MGRRWQLLVWVLWSLLARAACNSSGDGECTVSFDMNDYAVEEGGSVAVTVSITAPGRSIEDVNVTLTSSDDGTAVAGSDYTAVSMPLMFTNSTRELTVTVQTSADREVEGTETFSLSLSVTVDMMVDGVVLPDPATVSITDRSAVVRFGMTAYQAKEGVTLTVTASVMDGILDREVTVTVTSMSGTAMSGSDFPEVSEMIMFSETVASGTVAITPSNDTVLEYDEMFTLSLTTDDQFLDVSSTTTITITDTTVVTVMFKEGSLTATEGSPAAFEVVVTGSTIERDVALTVTPIANGSAGADVDFMSGAVNLTLNTSAAVGGSVMTLSDSVVEADEMFLLNLTVRDSSVSVDGVPANVTITDNTTLVVQFNRSSYQLSEGTATVANLTAATELDREVTVTIEPASNDDYRILPSSVTFNSSTAVAELTIEAIADNLDEAAVEMFTVSLVSDVLLATTSVSLTINETTTNVDVMVGDTTLAEGESTYLNLTATEPFDGFIVVDLTTVPGEEILIQQTLVNITAPGTVYSVKVTALEDNVLEGEQVVTINISSGSNAALMDQMITVLDRTLLLYRGLQSQGVLIGKPVEFTCIFQAAYNITISWTKDGVPYSPHPSTTAVPGEESSYNSTLRIDSVGFDDCGRYTCTVGDVSSYADLGVVEVLNTSNQSPIFSVGAVGVLSCSIRRCGPFSIDWQIYNDSATVFPFPVSVNTSNTSSVEGAANTEELVSEVTIDTVGWLHNGSAQSCDVSYNDTVELTTRVFFDFNLENVDVEILFSPENRTDGNFTDGETVVLNCTATNPPGVDVNITFKFVWISKSSSENDVDLVTNPGGVPGVEVTTGENSVVLTMPDIKDGSPAEASYVCKVYNRLIADAVDVNIDVDVISGPILSFPDTGHFVNLGDDLTITCRAQSSNPPATFIEIRVNGTQVANTTIETALSYTIMDPPLSANGTLYECFAINPIGNETVNFTLVVRDRPDAVNSSTIQSTLVSLLVSRITWDPPEANNAPITGYTVTACNTEVEEDCGVTAVTETSAVVYLVPTVRYNITVTATNVVGARISDVRSIVGFTGVANVTQLKGTPLSSSVVLLEWNISAYVVNQTTQDGMGVFSVEEYIIRVEGKVVTRVSDRNLLYEVPDGVEGTSSTVIFVVEVVYSDVEINIRLETTVTLTVNIPAVVPIPDINLKPLGPVMNITSPDPDVFGFTFSWSPPALITNTDLLSEYRVLVKRLTDGGRRKRQINKLVSSTNTSFEFSGGIAFTNYNVSVTGELNRNGVEESVVALAETTLQTAEGVPTAPLEFVSTSNKITSVVLEWAEPASPKGIIIEYQLRITPDPPSGGASRKANGPATGIEVFGLRGHTEYTVTIRAMNRKNLGTATTHIFTTNFGVAQPSISSVISNFDSETYSFRIERFSDLYGPLSHYEVYAVVVDDDSPPDTGTIKGSTDDAYIASAGPASQAPTTITIGNGESGEYTVPGNRVKIAYENKEVRLGATYYFFVRLYSELDLTRFNDSEPDTPTAVIPEPSTSSDTTVIIIAVVLGTLALLLIAVLVVLVLFAVRGKIGGNYTVPHLRRFEGGEKGGIELRRRTRNFTPVLDVGDSNVFTSAGQPTTLVCEVSGTPAPTIKWTHEGKPVDDERCLVLADHSLFIQNTSLEDEGSYLVTAENSTGSSTAQIKVTVLKPSPPDRDEAHPTVSVDNFTEYYARMKANEGDDLDDEYQDVEPEFAQTSYAAKLAINRNKNRYINIIPYDHSRVVLALQENTPGSDYVNASFIDGYKRTNQYIASQGPTTTTLADFWRMVWELDCPTIVMVTKLEEEDKRKCEQYWPSYGSTTYGNVQVTLKEAENLAEYSIRTFSVSPLAGQSSAQMPVREVKQFHFLKWPDHGVPNYATALLHFRKRVYHYHPIKRGPMIVHCSAGVGRTGTFITVDYSLDRMEGEGVVDIFNFVQLMRFKRNYMVQTSSQYEFIHEAIHEAIMCGDTSIKAPELKEWLGKLTPDPETGKTLLHDQFKRLESASPQDEEFDCTVAEMNKDKNRITKHLPANDQRVVLSSEDDMCDYISASYVDGYRQRNAFMITQGPMESTVGDFWRMVWEQKSAAIVMLTPLEEDGEEMSRKYWSDEVGEAAVFGIFHVELTSEVRDLGDYCTRKIKLSPISKPQESRIVTQFHFGKWSRSVSPESAKPMIDMIDELQRVQRKSGNQPITVHCNDGLGRTGTFCTLYYVLDRVKAEQVVDVFQAVKTLRIQRTGLVANMEQFKFVHTATMEFLNTFSDYQNFK